MKDETGGASTRICWIDSKMDSFLVDDSSEHKKVKG